MFRKDLTALLLNNPKSVSQLATEVGEKPGDIAEDLQHFLLSLKHTNYKAVIEPAHCRKCGFEFSTSKLKKPSRCPECKATWIAEAKISLSPI